MTAEAQTLRRAGPDEAALLTAIALASKRHWGYPEAWIRSWQAQLTVTVDYIRSNPVWLAFCLDKPAGFAALSVLGRRACLDHLWVLPEHMGRGIGRALWMKALAEARALQCTSLEIESDPNAVGFYEKMGARRVGERHTQVDSQDRSLPILELLL